MIRAETRKMMIAVVTVRKMIIDDLVPTCIRHDIEKVFFEASPNL
jgi:hypothetical protein